MPQFVGGRYQLIAQLGGGGMADVYLAKLTGKADFAKLAVVKRLKSLEEDDPDILQMFAGEARLCARLNHPNIVQTFEVGEDTNGPFLVMEFIEGQPLGRIRSRANRRGVVIPRAFSLKVIRDTVSALAYAHALSDHDGSELNVIHRDVSPENIMMTYAGLTKLVDFGVAKTSASMNHTRAGVIKGKVAYMAPEQARSDVNIDGRADIFAVGLILWELLARKRMWEGLSETEVIQRLLDEDPLPHARSVEPDLPESLDVICAKALSKNPSDRFASANDFLDALEDACKASDLRASPREIGQFVANLFEAEREKVKALVSGSVTKPRRDVSNVDGSPVPPFQDPASIEPRTSSEPRESMLPNWKATSPGSTNPLGGLGTSSNTLERSSLRPGTSVGVAETIHAVVPAPRTKMQVVGVAVLALAAVLGALSLWSRIGTSPSQAQTPAMAVRVESQPPSAPVPTEVSVDVTVKPAAAKIFVDGKLAEGNPYHLRAPRANANHEIRLEADGYEARSILLSFDRDHVLDMTLVKREQPSLPPPVAPPPVAVPRLVPSPVSAPPSVRPAPVPHGTTSATAAESAAARGISEIEPAKPKASTRHDKIDTDIFKR